MPWSSFPKYLHPLWPRGVKPEPTPKQLGLPGLPKPQTKRKNGGTQAKEG